MTRLAALLATLFALLVSAPAEAANHMSVSLVPETRGVAPGGTVTLAFVMRPQAGWHGYWRNPGDAGTEPRVEWRLGEQWRADPLQYPVPQRLSVAGLMNYVFERDYALLATIHVPADAEPGVRRCVARNDRAPAEVLRALAFDEDAAVRGWVAANPSVPGEVLRALAEDADPTVRAVVAWAQGWEAARA